MYKSLIVVVMLFGVISLFLVSGVIAVGTPPDCGDVDCLIGAAENCVRAGTFDVSNEELLGGLASSVTTDIVQIYPDGERCVYEDRKINKIVDRGRTVPFQDQGTICRFENNDDLISLLENIRDGNVLSVLATFVQFRCGLTIGGFEIGGNDLPELSEEVELRIKVVDRAGNPISGASVKMTGEEGEIDLGLTDVSGISAEDVMLKRGKEYTVEIIKSGFQDFIYTDLVDNDVPDFKQVKIVMTKISDPNALCGLCGEGFLNFLCDRAECGDLEQGCYFVDEGDQCLACDEIDSCSDYDSEELCDDNMCGSGICGWTGGSCIDFGSLTKVDVRVRVYNETNSPIAGAVVVLKVNGRENQNLGVTGTDGSLIGEVFAGTNLIFSVSKEGFDSKNVEYSLPAGAIQGGHYEVDVILIKAGDGVEFSVRAVAVGRGNIEDANVQVSVEGVISDLGLTNDGGLSTFIVIPAGKSVTYVVSKPAVYDTFTGSVIVTDSGDGTMIQEVTLTSLDLVLADPNDADDGRDLSRFLGRSFIAREQIFADTCDKLAGNYVQKSEIIEPGAVGAQTLHHCVEMKAFDPGSTYAVSYLLVDVTECGDRDGDGEKDFESSTFQGYRSLEDATSGRVSTFFLCSVRYQGSSALELSEDSLFGSSCEEGYDEDPFSFYVNGEEQKYCVKKEDGPAAGSFGCEVGKCCDFDVGANALGTASFVVDSDGKKYPDVCVNGKIKEYTCKISVGGLEFAHTSSEPVDCDGYQLGSTCEEGTNKCSDVRGLCRDSDLVDFSNYHSDESLRTPGSAVGQEDRVLDECADGKIMEAYCDGSIPKKSPWDCGEGFVCRTDVGENGEDACVMGSLLPPWEVSLSKELGDEAISFLRHRGIADSIRNAERDDDENYIMQVEPAAHMIDHLMRKDCKFGNYFCSRRNADLGNRILDDVLPNPGRVNADLGDNNVANLQGVPENCILFCGPRNKELGDKFEDSKTDDGYIMSKELQKEYLEWMWGDRGDNGRARGIVEQLLFHGTVPGVN
jgi:hypothetical protein